MNKLNTETQLPQTIVSDCLFRVCSKCDIEKEIIFFAIVNGRKRKDGTVKKRIHSQCKECRQKMCKDWRIDNPEYQSEKCKEWRFKNPEKVISDKLEYKKKYPDKVKLMKKNWDIKNTIHRYNYNKKQVENLSVNYVKTNLVSQGFKRKQITKELVEVKTIIIKTQRLWKTSQI